MLASPSVFGVCVFGPFAAACDWPSLPGAELLGFLGFLHRIRTYPPTPLGGALQVRAGGEREPRGSDADSRLSLSAQ